MANLTIALAGTLTVTDTSQSPAPNIVTRNLGNPSLPVTTMFFDTAFQAAITGSTVNLPAATVYLVYIKNVDTTNNLTVNWTTVGGGSQVFTLLPGSFMFYFLTAETAGGVTALSLTGNVATTSAEVLVAK